MADWKQITARIRRARTGKDPAGQLANLFQKTRDAMVAFELARYFETAGANADAAKWYATAAERFRRADWRTKAQEAAVRLGAQADTQDVALAGSSERQANDFVAEPQSIPEPGLPFEQTAEAFEAIVTQPEGAADEVESASVEKPAADKKRRRRGRRGGRNRRKSAATSETLPAATGRLAEPASSRRHASPPTREFSEPRATEPLSLPSLPVEPLSENAEPAVRGRYGDPGLSSRLSLLEMQFRRLLTCAPARLDEADRAPVGPGVFLLTDSDLTSYYYVEACQTLRIAIGNLLRSGASRRGGDSIKAQLASHLGIAETRVPKYLAEHCVVRWLQLDEGASHFAHFVIAVLRPTLNE